jgi:hypothetical protein
VVLQSSLEPESRQALSAATDQRYCQRALDPAGKEHPVMAAERAT